MRIWTTLLSLVLVSLMVCNVYAGRGGKGKGGGQLPSFSDIVGSDTGKLTKDKFVEARTKNAPEDQKDQAKQRAERMWDRMAEGKSELTKDEYEAATAKMREAMKGKMKGKRRGGGE